jgi:hypothetical protein
MLVAKLIIESEVLVLLLLQYWNLLLLIRIVVSLKVKTYRAWLQVATIAKLWKFVRVCHGNCNYGNIEIEKVELINYFEDFELS